MKEQLRVEKRPGCIAAALHILGDKWTPLIIGYLGDGPKTFGDIESFLETISPRTLSQRLDKLVDEKIVAKNIYCEHPPRYTYALTHKGADLSKVLGDMADWGARHYNTTEN